jgi:tRNA pseudouridine38-40 synthase
LNSLNLPLQRGFSIMRIAMGIEYDGTNYFGWQSQAFDQLPTLQDTLAQAISSVADQTVNIIAAGRTDAGVHATGQVIHFDTHVIRTEHAWVMGTNSRLPKDMVVHWAKSVPEDFHARFSATKRRYQYLIFNSKTRSALFHHRAAFIYEPLEAALMHDAAQCLVGEHDFSAFRAAECQSKTAMRNIEYIKIERQGNFVCCEIQANAFLHHMVRNIMGTLIKVGAGIHPAQTMKEILGSRDRRQAGATAPACGLYLVKVIY